MTWALVVVIAILVIRDLIREYQRHERDIDLIDRALPRSDEELKTGAISQKIKGVNEGRKRRKRIKVEDETAGNTSTGAGKHEW